MIIYLDKEFKCHLTDDGTMTPCETDYFDSKCQAYIEGYRCIPEGEVWVREDGEVFAGLMFSPWKDYTQLYITQLEYELEDADAALREVGVLNG